MNSNKEAVKKAPLLLIIKRNLAIYAIFFLGLGLRVYMALLDPMLHDWDERYHALVAKNMAKYPFKPMLYVHQYFTTNPYNWTFNHIWLHKQPLFLWQMALSMKLFGVSEFTMRLPSVVMGSLMILLVYRICVLATGNRVAALLSALLLCFNNYYLNLISGREGMDHNDVAFGFYVLASLWAYAEYLRAGRWRWALLIGFFAGCAVLNKWLTGIIVFAPWGIQTIVSIIQTRKPKPVAQFVSGLAVCVIVFLPWQLYILSRFHELAVYEYAFNRAHIWQVVEGHSGDVWTYLNSFPYYFGWYANYLVPIGAVWIFFLKRIKWNYRILLILPTLLVFCFFSFIVQTKIRGYFFMMAPVCIILAGIALQNIIDLFGRFKLLPAVVLIPLCVYWSLNFKQINSYTRDVNYRQAKIYNTNIYKKLDGIVPKDITVVLNANFQEHVDIMFYSDRLEVYHSDISKEEFERVTKNGMKIAAFKSRENHELPDYISSYKHLYLIDEKLR